MHLPKIDNEFFYYSDILFPKISVQKTDNFCLGNLIAN